MSKARDFFAELKERQVIKTLVLYVAIGWGFYEIASEFLTRFGFAEHWITLLLIFVLLGLPAALFLSWYFDVDRRGIREESRLGRADWIVISASVLLPVVGVLVAKPLIVENQSVLAAGRSAVAILPFGNLTGDNALDYLADGVAEEVLTTLSSIPEFDVSAMTQSFRYRGEIDIDEAARQLRVAWLVRGSVRASGQHLRFSASLVDARSGETVWSRSTDTSKLALFRGQEELSQAVVSALASVTNIEINTINDQYTPDPEAYELYLRGRYVWHRRGTVEMGPAVAMLAEATRIDPGFADAWAALASAYLTWPGYSSEGRSTWHSSEDVALKAIELDPELPEPYAVLATHAEQRQEWLSANRFFRESLRLNDKSATVHYWFGEHLASTGRYVEAVRHLRRAIDLDPTYVAPRSDLAFAYLTLGAFELGAAEFKDSWDAGFRNAINWMGNFIAQVVLDRFGDARDWIAASELADEAKSLLLRFVNAQSGTSEPQLPHDIVNASGSVLDYRLKIWMLARLGENDLAIRLAEERLDNGYMLDVRPLWGIGIRLYEHHRFIPIIERLNLVDYWREAGWGDVCRPVADDVFCDGHNLRPETLRQDRVDQRKQVSLE